MNELRKEQYKKFLEQKDELIESLAADFAKAFEEAGPQSVWHVFTPVHEAAEQIKNGTFDHYSEE